MPKQLKTKNCFNLSFESPKRFKSLQTALNLAVLQLSVT